VSLSGPILWPPTRENWRIGSFSSVPLLPPKERTHFHPAHAPYFPSLFTFCPLLVLSLESVNFPRFYLYSVTVSVLSQV